jgi:hypothetical protein
MKRFFRAEQARTSCTGAGGTTQSRRPVSCSGIPSRSTGAVPAALPPTQRLFYRTVAEQQQVSQHAVQQQQQESTDRKEDKGKDKESGREQRLEELMQLQRQRHSLRQQQQQGKQQQQGRQEVDDSMLDLDSTNCVCTVFPPMSSKTTPNKNGHQKL